MIIAIKRGINSDKVYLRFKQFFHRSLNDLKLSQMSEELIREKRKKILILGLVVSILVVWFCLNIMICMDCKPVNLDVCVWLFFFFLIFSCKVLLDPLQKGKRKGENT